MPFFSIVLWCAVRTSHVAVAAADTNIFINHHKAIFTLVPDAIIFLPVAASIFINTAETDFRAKIFKIFARQFAGFTASTAAGIDKKSILCGHGLLLKPFRSGQDCCATGFPLLAVKGGERSEY
ncbi:Uncharacterised protein [Shigella flexneri]|nr:Uncharacterised protein [Shigella flexneri]